MIINNIKNKKMQSRYDLANKIVWAFVAGLFLTFILQLSINL